MKNRTLKFALFGVLLVSGLFAQPTRQWKQGDPSPEEQYALEVINRIRIDAVGAADLYLDYALKHPTSPLGVMVSNYKPSGTNLTGAAGVRYAVKSSLDYWNNFRVGPGKGNPGQTPAPKAPLTLYPMFTAQARGLEAGLLGVPAASLAAVGFNSVETDSLASFWDSTNAGFPSSVPSPKVAYRTDTSGAYTVGNGGVILPALSGPNATGGTAVTRVSSSSAPFWYRGSQQFLVNLYDPSISLREAFIGSGGGGFLRDSVYHDANTNVSGGAYGTTRMIGLSLGATRTAGPGVGSRVLGAWMSDNEIFAVSDLPYGVNTIFVTGVAYKDNDADGDYTPGEGLPNLKVTLSTGDWFAVTASAGGYAIPVSPNAGVITVTAEGFSPVTVTVGAENVKVDFVTPADKPVKPAQVPVPASTGSATLGNLSARGTAGTGANALIVGFVIEGTANKTLLIRGDGPSLAAFGVAGAMDYTKLTVYDSKSNVIASNLRWFFDNTTAMYNSVVAATAAVGAFPVAKTSGDSALVLTLAPGAYSAAITPGNGSSGVALAEVYDVSKTDGSRLINLSTRGNITNDKPIIVGFVITGSGTKRVLVRGVGPSLKAFGITAPLPDPVATLYNSASAPILQNDDWSVSAATDQIGTLSPTLGAFPLNDGSVDSVILTALPPGGYTVIVTPKYGSGIGLIEMYDAR